jgi:hypothetical protein
MRKYGTQLKSKAKGLDHPAIHLELHMLTHYPATLQNYKATRPCKSALPRDLGVKQAKGLTFHHWPKTVDAIRNHLQGGFFQPTKKTRRRKLGHENPAFQGKEEKKRSVPMGLLEARSPTPQRRSLDAKT